MSLSFTSDVNLILNLSIMLIWFLTFSVLCQFSPYNYPWMENADASNGIVKNYFSCHVNCQLYIYVRLLTKTKKTN